MAIICALLASLVPSILAAAVYTQQDLGTFASPGTHVRPRFRYWLPDASVDSNIVISDIKSAGSIGAGGVEFLPFYNYGGSLGIPSEVDWSSYGFGTDAYKKLLKDVLRAMKEHGLVVDLPLGPNQGQGVPSETDNPGLQWDLVHFTTEVPANGSFDGVIPGWNISAKLVSVNTAHVLSQEQATSISVGISTTVPSNWTVFHVDYDSIYDHTVKVDTANGGLTLRLPAVPENQHYQLTAIYEVQTLQRACAPGNEPQNFIQNGSFVVDHFSGMGARVVTDFWDRYMLDTETKGLLQSIGNYMWEDSLEIVSAVNWTPDLPQVFQETHGYEIYKYLPLLLWGNNNINIQSQQPGSHRFLSNNPDQDQAFINDYRKVLAVCYSRYVRSLRDWSHQSLKMGLSLQTSYNLPTDALANIPAVDAPETETIQFGKGEIDSLKQFAGPAFLAGKSVLSCEMGGEFGSAYRQTLAHLLFLLNRSYAGGVNQQVIHGQTYSGEYSNTTWPGLTPFNYIVADAWSQRQPCWNNGYADLLHYAGRASFTQQSGVPKFDIAFYQKDSITDPNFGVRYNYSDLVAAGYTYNYLSPENFELPQAKVYNRTLSPQGPSYKALVVQGSQNLTIGAAEKLMEYSKAGLPIIFASGMPGIYPESQNNQEGIVKATIESLSSYANVYMASEGQIATRLADIGIAPRLAVSGSDSLYTTWRDGGPDGIDFAFLYSDLEPSIANITLTTSKFPYIFDPWTGTQTALLEYEQGAGYTTIPIDLAANQSLIIGFAAHELQDSPSPNFHIAKLPAIVLGYETSSDRVVAFKFGNLSTSGTSHFTTSTSRTYVLDPFQVQQPFELTDWSLTVEHWAPPANISNLSIDSVKSNTTQQVRSPLLPWTGLPGLNQTAGLGFYTTNFTWEPADDEGAFLYLDAIKHTARVTVNGQSTQPFDMARPKLDITPYLRSGNNEITIVISTTLWNAIRPVLSELYSTGSNLLASGLLPEQLPSDEGLVGSVSIVPYKMLSIQE